MRVKRSETVEFNVYLSNELYAQLQNLQNAGLSLSAVSRLAVAKCSELSLGQEEDSSTPKRVLIYLHPEESELLSEICAREGYRSRSQTLRRLIATYLRVNDSAIKALF